MQLTEEDKAILIAAAKILMREPENIMFEYDDIECSHSYHYEEVAESLCDMTNLAVFFKMIPLKYILDKIPQTVGLIERAEALPITK